MPIEIREVTIKAEVENPKADTRSASKENLDIKEVNIELLLDAILQKIKTKNER